MTARTQSKPRIQWDGTTWFVRLPVEDGNLLEAKWSLGLTYVVRTRQAGTEAWSFGFETPLTHFSFNDLKPDTEYEMEVRARNAAGGAEPSLIRMRTNPAGHTDDVIPFPKRWRPARPDRASAVDFSPFAGPAFADELQQRLELPCVGAPERVNLTATTSTMALAEMTGKCSYDHWLREIIHFVTQRLMHTDDESVSLPGHAILAASAPRCSAKPQIEAPR